MQWPRTFILVQVALCFFFIEPAVASHLDTVQVIRVKKGNHCIPELAERIVRYLNNNKQLAETLSLNDLRGCKCDNEPRCVWGILQDKKARYAIDVELVEVGNNYNIVATLHDDLDRTSGVQNTWNIKISAMPHELPRLVSSLLTGYQADAVQPFAGAIPGRRAIAHERQRRILDAVGVSLGVISLAAFGMATVLATQDGEPVAARCPRIPEPRPCVLQTQPLYIAGFIGGGLFGVGAGLLLGIR